MKPAINNLFIVEKDTRVVRSYFEQEVKEVSVFIEDENKTKLIAETNNSEAWGWWTTTTIYGEEIETEGLARDYDKLFRMILSRQRAKTF